MLDRLALWLCGLLVLSSACKSREDPGATGTKVTAESEYDATEPLVDDNYRFRLVTPGPGWKLLHTVDIRQLVPISQIERLVPGREMDNPHVAGVSWLVLVGLVALRLATDSPRLRSDARDVGALTSVAAAGVLGTRLDLAGWPAAAVAFWAIALVLWLVLMPLAARGWPRATTGSHFLVVVATQAVAILAAAVTWRHGVQGLVPVGFAITVPAEGLVGRMSLPTMASAIALAIITPLVARWFWQFGLRHYSGASA